MRFYWINGSFKPFNHTAGCCSLYDDSLAGAGAVYEFPVLVPVAVLVRSESTGDLGTGASFNFGAGQSLPVLVLVPVPVIVYRWLGCCFRSTGLGSDSSESLHAPRAPLPVRVLSCRIRCRCDRLMWRLSVWASAVLRCEWRSEWAGEYLWYETIIKLISKITKRDYFQHHIVKINYIAVILLLMPKIKSQIWSLTINIAC